MLEIISNHPKLFLGVFTPVILCVGYFYRDRKGKKENLKAALYVILEIWHRMSVLYRKDFDVYFDTLADVLIKRVPEAAFTDEQRTSAKEYFTPILKEVAQSSAFSDVEHYQESFENAVRLVAADDPFFAYKIGSAGKTKDFLKAIDQYLESAFKPLEEEGGDGLIFSETLKQHLTSHASIDVLSELEGNIYQLSLRISFASYVKSLMVVKRRKKKLSTFSKREVEKLLEIVLFPAMAEFNRERQAKL